MAAAVETDPTIVTRDVLSAGGTPRRELWRYLILAALAGLCLEIYLTRRLVRGQSLSSKNQRGQDSLGSLKSSINES